MSANNNKYIAKYCDIMLYKIFSSQVGCIQLSCHSLIVSDKGKFAPPQIILLFESIFVYLTFKTTRNQKACNIAQSVHATLI